MLLLETCIGNLILYCIILAILLTFWDKVILNIFTIAIIFMICISCKDYFIQLNETSKDKKKREELEKIREWSRRNRC